MGQVIVDLSVSLDGFIAGPDDGEERPLGRGGEALFAWLAAGTPTEGTDERLAPPAASQVNHSGMRGAISIRFSFCAAFL